MTCHDSQDALVDLARGSANPVPGDVAAHLAQCPACAARFEREQALTAGLRALAQSAASAQASPQTEARLLAAFAAAQPARTGRPSPAWRSLAAIAAALVLMVAAAATWWTSGPSHPPALPANAAQAAPGNRTPPPAATPNPPAVVARGAATRPIAAPARPRPKRITPPSPRASQPMDFVALPGTAGLPQFESGEIMRLEMPLASLASYGIDISRASNATAVQADVLVGQDGQARAIRLVTTDTTSRSRQQ